MWYGFVKTCSNPELLNLRNSLKSKYPGLELDVWENSSGNIELNRIVVPKEMRSKGIGTAVIKEIQQYAQSIRKPIVLMPSPESRKKKALENFYKNLNLTSNKGRNVDYQLSSPFGRTMYWKPRPIVPK